MFQKVDPGSNRKKRLTLGFLTTDMLNNNAQKMWQGAFDVAKERDIIAVWLLIYTSQYYWGNF